MCVSVTPSGTGSAVAAAAAAAPAGFFILYHLKYDQAYKYGYYRRNDRSSHFKTPPVRYFTLPRRPRAVNYRSLPDNPF